jgi:hypothetical protein
MHANPPKENEHQAGVEIASCITTLMLAIALVFVWAFLCTI